MRSNRFRRAALLASGCALVLTSAPPLAAQERKEDGEQSPAEERGAKRAPEPPKKAGLAAEHKALTQANQLAISEAHALAGRAADKDIALSKVLVNRHVEAIARALDTARLQLAELEGSALNEARKRQLQGMRDAYDRAAGHQTRLQQLAGQAQLDPFAIEQEAKRIAEETEDAEGKHRKLIGPTPEPARKPS